MTTARVAATAGLLGLLLSPTDRGFQEGFHAVAGDELELLESRDEWKLPEGWSMARHLRTGLYCPVAERMVER